MSVQPLTSLGEWLFRNRRTGQITVAQFPNAALLVWMVGSALLLLINPQGRLRDVLVVVAALGLAAWAIDEVVRGVNPFRRILGAGVITWMLVGFLHA